jgi:hypothetical protein
LGAFEADAKQKKEKRKKKKKEKKQQGFILSAAYPVGGRNSHLVVGDHRAKQNAKQKSLKKTRSQKKQPQKKPDCAGQTLHRSVTYFITLFVKKIYFPFRIADWSSSRALSFFTRSINAVATSLFSSAY